MNDHVNGQARPKLRTDLLLLHAPAFFDFRDRGDIYFPYLSTSGDVPITPLYEYFPIGFKTLQRYLGQRGHAVALLNLASLLLEHPRLDLEGIFASLDAALVGIDLHWMIHCQGSLEVARLLRRARPDLPIVFGGISATYYAAELVAYPFVDMVMRGYDTHEPMALLMSALKATHDVRSVPNLLWKDRDGRVCDNGYRHRPTTLACGVDWSTMEPASGQRPSRDHALPILELLSTQNAGCRFDCGWCGGSRLAFARIHGGASLPRKALAEIDFELDSAKAMASRYHFYAVGTYNESGERLAHFLARVGEAKFRSVSYEQFELTPEPILRAMAKANPRTSITLSPESHDLRVAKLAGRGRYTPEAMEAWIERALDCGIFQIDVWYFIGMPEQDPASVWATVEYCEKLLRRFKGKRVVPMLCPMIPLLDPGSTFFEEPEQHGYRIFARGLEEHRQLLGRASLINRINYETRWLKRSELVTVGYAAVRALVHLKAELGRFPPAVTDWVSGNIDDALEFIDAVHQVDCIPEQAVRERELDKLSPEIRRRNHAAFFEGVENQAFPVRRAIGGRWFDEVPPELDVGDGSLTR